MPKGKRKVYPTQRPPALRGVMVVDEIHGKPRLRAWPRARGPNRHPTNRRWTDWLNGMTYLWRYQPSKFKAQLEEATKGTPWMPRDPFISAARGRAWSFTADDGRTYYPKVVKEAVSQSLDSIGQIVGNMLYRAATGWEPVPPPEGADKLLASTGIDTVPEWVDPPESGGALDAWSPITPPETAHADDDEFLTPGSGTPSGWTEFDPAGTQTVAVDDAGLVLTHTPSLTDKWGGIYKAVPSGNWTAWVRLSLSARLQNDPNAGLCLWENPTDATKKLTTFGLRWQSNAGQIAERNWTDYDSFNGDQITVLQQGNPATTAWLRIRKTSTTYKFDFSRDGLGWSQVDSRTISYVPSHIGPAANMNGGTENLTARFAFFRVVASDVGIGGLMSGRRV